MALDHLCWVSVSRRCLRDAAGAASVRRGWGCPVPDTAGSSRLQPTHRRAQLSPSAKMVVKMYLRKGKEMPQRQRKRKKSVRNDPADTKLREEGGGGGAPGARAEIPLQSLEETMAEQVDIS